MKKVILMLLVVSMIFMSLGLGFACDDPEPECWMPPRCTCRIVHRPCGPCQPKPMPMPMPMPCPGPMMPRMP